MSDAILRALERDAVHDQVAREALWRARLRLGLGWSGEPVPAPLEVHPEIPGVYRPADSAAERVRVPRRFVFVSRKPAGGFYVTVYPVLSGREPTVGARPFVRGPWRLPTKLEADLLMVESPSVHEHAFPSLRPHLLFAFGPGPHECCDEHGEPIRPHTGARCGRVFATSERPHGVGPFDLLGNVWEWDDEGGLYGGLARNLTGGFRLLVDAVA